MLWSRPGGLEGFFDRETSTLVSLTFLRVSSANLPLLRITIDQSRSRAHSLGIALPIVER